MPKVKPGWLFGAKKLEKKVCLKSIIHVVNDDLNFVKLKLR